MDQTSFIERSTSWLRFYQSVAPKGTFEKASARRFSSLKPALFLVY